MKDVVSCNMWELFVQKRSVFQVLVLEEIRGDILVSASDKNSASILPLTARFLWFSRSITLKTLEIKTTINADKICEEISSSF